MDQLDIIVLDAGAHTVRAGRAQDFPIDAQSPYAVLPSAVRASGVDDADSTQTSVSKVLRSFMRLMYILPFLYLCSVRCASSSLARPLSCNSESMFNCTHV